MPEFQSGRYSNSAADPKTYSENRKPRECGAFALLFANRTSDLIVRKHLLFAVGAPHSVWVVETHRNDRRLVLGYPAHVATLAIIVTQRHYSTPKGRLPCFFLRGFPGFRAARKAARKALCSSMACLSSLSISAFFSRSSRTRVSSSGIGSLRG